jgi:hypothetical protein
MNRCLRACAVLAPSLLLCGCMFTTRKLPVPKPPSLTQTVTGENLVIQLNQRWAAMNTLNATVDMQASVLKSKEGIARDYTSIRGIILMRKPGMLRVLGRIPVLGTPMFDMATDGQDFTLRIPPKSMAYKGANKLKKRSASAIENMRPGFFMDALAVRGLEPDEEYMVTADSDTIEDAQRKHLFLVPEYKLTIMRAKPGSHEKIPLRIITFHRDDLMPYEQDVYDEHGNLETQIRYFHYADYGENRYPSIMMIKRPQEDLQIMLTVEKVTVNQPLTDDQFQIHIPEGTRIKILE